MNNYPDFSAEQGALRTPRLDRLYTLIQQMLTQEQKAGRVNSLEAFHVHTQRREHINGYWQHLTLAYRQLEEAMKSSPVLPVWEQIQWAQTVLAMPNLAFMEIDTTGLDQLDEVIRFTLVNADGEMIEDCLIRPVTRTLDNKASAVNGIKPEQLERSIPLERAWERIQQALRGRYIISFNQDWDIQQLHRAAEQHRLTPGLVIGDCLQRHATRYYNGEYYLTLAELCSRVGSPLPPTPNQTSLDRARGQRAVLQAFAQAITDIRQPLVSMPQMAGTSSQIEAPADNDFDPFLDSDDLP